VRALFVVANMTGTAWFSHVETERVMWTKKLEYATTFSSYTAKRVAKKYGGTAQPWTSHQVSGGRSE